MELNKFFAQKNFLFFLLILVFLLGFFFGWISFQGIQANKIFETKKKELANQIKKEFYDKLAERGIVSLDVSGFSEIQAEVLEKGRDYFLVKVIHPFDPLNYLFPEKVKVNIGKETKIISQTPQDPELLAKATYEYNKALQEGKTPPEFPPLVVEKEIPLNEIEVGNTILISSNENIRQKGEFLASVIKVSKPLEKKPIWEIQEEEEATKRLEEKETKEEKK